MSPLSRIIVAARTAARDVEVETGRGIAAADGRSLFVPTEDELGPVKRAVALAALSLMRQLPGMASAPARAAAARALVALSEVLLEAADVPAASMGGGHAGA